MTHPTVGAARFRRAPPYGDFAPLVLVLGMLVLPSPGYAQEGSAQEGSAQEERARQAPTRRATETVEGVAAVVGADSPQPGAQTWFISDVSLRARIALSGQQSQLPLGPLPAPLLRAVLDELIGEALIEREADRLQASEPSDEEIETELRRFETQAGGAERLRALLNAVAAERSELRAMARRRAYVNTFLHANLEGATEVSDAEVQRTFDSEDNPFPGRELEGIREVLRVWLGRRALQREVARWIGVLRSRHTIHILAPFGGTGD